MEKDSARIPIIKRWFNFKSNFPIENKVEFNNFQRKCGLITLYEEFVLFGKNEVY